MSNSGNMGGGGPLGPAWVGQTQTDELLVSSREKLKMSKQPEIYISRKGKGVCLKLYNN